MWEMPACKIFTGGLDVIFQCFVFSTSWLSFHKGWISMDHPSFLEISCLFLTALPAKWEMPAPRMRWPWRLQEWRGGYSHLLWSLRNFCLSLGRLALEMTSFQMLHTVFLQSQVALFPQNSWKHTWTGSWSFPRGGCSPWYPTQGPPKAHTGPHTDTGARNTLRHRCTCDCW